MKRTVSVGILTRNPGKAFAETLEAIRRQRRPAPVETVILDSGSTDGTPALARRMGARVHSLDPGKFIFGDARDLLFSLCKGEVVATISQDAVPKNEKWLSRLVAPILQSKADIVGGGIDSSGSDFFWERNGLFNSTRGWQRFVEANGGFGLSCVNLAVRRSVWKSVRFVSTPMCEDKLFQQRAYRLRLTMVRQNGAAVLHSHDYNIRSLFIRCANEGMGLHYVGMRYRLRDMLGDMLCLPAWRFLFRGLRRGEVRRPAECLFPVLSPAGMWYGNTYLREYWDGERK